MIVISDTSPIHYLVQTGHVGVLPLLFGEVVIPAAVASELQHPATPAEVRQWITEPPAWLRVQSVTNTDPQIWLGHGEVEAISLALEINATLVLMDDRRARNEAERRGLTVVGTLNVMEAAAQRDLLDLPQAIAKLRQTNFHISDRILQHVLEADAERRRSQ